MVYFKGVVDSRSAERRAPGAGKIEDSERKKEMRGGVFREDFPGRVRWEWVPKIQVANMTMAHPIHNLI